MQAIILLGAPGSGKGTVAEDIKATIGFTHVSTGDMLRLAVKEGSPVGKEAKTYMEKGLLVPDSVIIKLVKERLDAGSATARYMFDGFPRTTAQAEMLDALLADNYKSSVNFAFLLDVPRSLLITRISGRRVCRQCGQVYHVKNIPSKKEGVCDQCGGELYQRPDDNEATVVNRLDVYEKQTASLISYYDRKGVLKRIDAEDRIATETEIRRIVSGLGA